jgi:hypothetical protein
MGRRYIEIFDSTGLEMESESHAALGGYVREPRNRRDEKSPHG